MDRVALWKALRSTGAPPFLIHLIADLHQGTTSRIRVGGRLSQPFRITSVVREGCVLAPALFCVAMDWIMLRCADTMGISVGSSTFTRMMPFCSPTVNPSGRIYYHTWHRCTNTWATHVMAENQGSKRRLWTSTITS